MTLVLAGIAAFIGLQHLWYWLERREERVHLWMIALGAGTLTFLRGYHLQIWSGEPGPAILGARLQWTGGTVLVVVLLGLVNRFVRRPVPRAAFAMAAIAGGAYVFCVWFTETVVRNAAVLRMPAAGRPYWGVGLGPVTFVFVPFTLAVAGYCVTVLARARGVERFERLVLLLAFGFYLIAGINEVLAALSVIVSVRLFPPSFAVLGVAFSILLARRYDVLARENERLLVEVRAQARALEGRNAELDAFAYTVSHDLRAPLVAIDGMAEMLVDHGIGQGNATAAHGLARIRANVHRMKRLIADVLLVSRVGREGHRPCTIPLLDVVDAVMDEFADAFRKRGFTVTRPDPVTVWGTQTHLEQVFRNLIGNALKFAADAGAPAIDVTTVDRGAMVECAVRDNGIGIDPAYHAKLFEMFHRFDDTTEGTGVGLALVKKIVEFNGGAVWVESTKGCGATFRFTWPKPPAPATPAASA